MRYVLTYQDEDGIWIATVPSFPGCVSDGDTREEALKNIKDAMEVWLESVKAHDEEIPPDIKNPAIDRIAL